MPGVRLIMALHNHQPVGNFDGVFAACYRDSYLPFLEVMEDYPAIPFVLHTSGPLLEWLVEHQPGYVARVRALVEAGRVEILGGGFYEPILPMIPHRDRVGQIRDYARFLNETFGTEVRGVWLAERVWEQQLVAALAEAGVEYTVLDDFHFLRAGVEEADLRGYFLTEEDGSLLKVFPIAERLRYLIPFREPHATYEYLKQVAADRPDSTVVFADDGEKFGAWPDTHDHVYRNGWLRRFCDMIVGNRDWLQATTFNQAVAATLPMGKIYLPDSSYREMTEWVLPPRRLTQFQAATRPLGATPLDPGDPAYQPQLESLRPFVRAGGAWRNFKTRYAETDEMYARMLGVSVRLAKLTESAAADPDYLESARTDLFRAQCNCPYWHGAFGGLYLPHLRNAIYRHLIAADAALDAAEGLTAPRVSIQVADFNLDARQEVRIDTDRLVAFIRPAQGGHVYELDFRQAEVNLLATLDRRPEAYHGTVVAAATQDDAQNDLPSIMDRVVLKQDDLDQRLVYDRHPRKALVDHFFAPETTLDDLVACRDVDLGDFAAGTYLSRVQRSGSQVAVVMERPGVVAGHPIQVRKSITAEAASGTLDVHYVLEDLPVGVPLAFAVEINIAAMAGHAHDRSYVDPTGLRLGMLDARLDLEPAEGLTLVDEWLDVAVGFRWSQPAALWCFPIETVSQSEGGFEGVYQSSAVVPRWTIRADESRRWEVRIRWSLEPAQVAAAAGEADPAPARWSLVNG